MFTNSSVSSGTSAPLTCENENCTFPFGPACPECEFVLQLHHSTKAKYSSEERTKKRGKGPVKRDIRLESKGKGREQNQGEEPQVERQGVNSDSSILESGYLSSSTENGASRSASPKLLDEWLSEIFSQTLDAQIEDKVFTGSADEEQVTDPCPLCHKSLGDDRDQHLFRCAYAQEEAKILERMRNRGASRR